MSQSLQSLPIVVALEDLSADERLLKIVSFTENTDDCISPETVYLLSLLIGNNYWVDTLELFRRGFPKYKLDWSFRHLIYDEIRHALLTHFKHTFENRYPNRRTIAMQEKQAQKFRSQMNWRSRKSGYHGVLINPDYADILNETRQFVHLFSERWRDNSDKTKQEKNYVYYNFDASTCLDWIFDFSSFMHRLREMEKEHGTP